jgi:hypothetical protein
MAMKAELDTMLSELRRIHGMSSKETSESKACLLPKLAAAGPAQRGWTTMYVVDSDQLAALIEAPPGAKRNDTNQLWRFVNSGIFPRICDGISRPLDATTTLELGDQAQEYNKSAPYLAVLRPTSRRMPQSGPEHAFDSGSFEGMLLIVDRETGRAACQTQIAAANSERVKTNALRIGFLNMAVADQQAVTDDFKKQLRQAAEATSRTMTNGQLGLSFPLLLDPG